MDIANEILEQPTSLKSKRKIPLTMTVNSIQYRLLVNPAERVIDLLRDRLLLFGEKDSYECNGYEENHMILVDGKVTNPSSLMASQVNGKSIIIF